MNPAQPDADWTGPFLAGVLAAVQAQFPPDEPAGVLYRYQGARPDLYVGFKNRAGLERFLGDSQEAPEPDVMFSGRDLKCDIRHVIIQEEVSN